VSPRGRVVSERDAVRLYRRFHWGRTPDKCQRITLPLDNGDRVIQLGELVAVKYRTGWEEFDRLHDFEGELPVLTYSPKGCLIVLGGEYHISARGIIG